SNAGSTKVKAALPPSIRQLTVRVTPPPYTQLKSYESTSPELKIPEGSIVQWDVVFTDTVHGPAIIVSGRDTINFKQKHDRYTLGLPFTHSGFYQIAWFTSHDAIGNTSSDTTVLSSATT